MAEKKKILVIGLVFALCLSVIANAYFVFALAKISRQLESRNINENVLAFRNMFTEKVLLADKEVDFETRMGLETAVRALNDQEIMGQWQRFTESETKEDASYQAKKLLRLLVQKTSSF